MNKTTAIELAQAVQKEFEKSKDEIARQSIARWLADQQSTRPGSAPYVPSSLVTEDVSTICVDSTLLIFFSWPLAPGRSFVYIETLEDLSPMSVEVWVDVVLAHFDETVGSRFHDLVPIIELGNLEFFGPAVGE
jgi:hypothetical protein